MYFFPAPESVPDPEVLLYFRNDLLTMLVSTRLRHSFIDNAIGSYLNRISLFIAIFTKSNSATDRDRL